MVRERKTHSRGYKIWRWLLSGMIGLAGLIVLVGRDAEDQGGIKLNEPVIFQDGEFVGIDGQEPLTARISGQTFQNQAVQYALIDGLPIFEGDIILDLGTSAPKQSGVAVTGRHYRWPNGIVPYEIHPNLPNQQRIHDAIAHWEANTPIRFVERNESNQGQYPNYVYFQPSFGCSSYVGMMGGKQPINLATACSTGSTIHEIGHALGLWHEQSREDRNQHVTIHYENIIPSMVFNFNQHISDGDDIGPYDYSSIMHYPRWAFSKNGKDTITPIGDQEIGQRSVLSEGDIAAVMEIYEGIAVGR